MKTKEVEERFRDCMHLAANLCEYRAWNRNFEEGMEWKQVLSFRRKFPVPIQRIFWGTEVTVDLQNANPDSD